VTVDALTVSGSRNIGQLRDLRWWATPMTPRGDRSTPQSPARIPTLLRWLKRSSLPLSMRLPADCSPDIAKVEGSGQVLRGTLREGDQITRRFFARIAGGWALQLSELITSHRSIEHRIGAVVVRGFVLDVRKVFENFLMTTTAAAIARRDRTGRAPAPARHAISITAAPPRSNLTGPGTTATTSLRR
jgi:hypothetical protein